MRLKGEKVMNLLKKFPKLGAVLIVGFFAAFLVSCEVELTDPEVIKSVRYTGVTINAPEKSIVTIEEGEDIVKVITQDGVTKVAFLEPGNAKIKIREKTKVTIHEIEIIKQITSFGFGENLTGYLNGNLPGGVFSKFKRLEVAPYTVGIDSPYIIDIASTSVVFDEQINPVISPITLTNDRLEYQLKIDGENVDFDTYATLSDEVGLQFKEAALGKEIEIVVSLRYNWNNLAPLSHTVLVQEGVNVYNNAELKTAFADLDVHDIHIQRNIEAALDDDQFYTLNGEKIPFNFNDITNEESRGVHGNVYRRYHETSIGELTIHGNYFTIDGSKLPLLKGLDAEVDDFGNDITQQGGFVDPDNTIVATQSSIFRSGVGTAGPESGYVKYENMYIIGNSNLPDSEDDTISGGYIGLRNTRDKMIVDNVRINFTTDGIYTTHTGTKAEINYVYITNSWAASILLWGTEETIINDSYLEKSGSAAITVVDDKDEVGGINDPVVYVNNTVINNIVSRNSPWFEAYQLKTIGLLVSQIESALQAINDFALSHGIPFDKSIIVTPETNPEDSSFNFAFLLQNSNPITNFDKKFQVRLIIDGVESYRTFSETEEPYKHSNDLIGAIASQGAVFMPHGYDLASAMVQKLAEHPDYQDVLQNGTAQQKEDVMMALFAEAVIEGTLTHNDKYLELHPDVVGADIDFKAIAIVEMQTRK